MNRRQLLASLASLPLTGHGAFAFGQTWSVSPARDVRLSGLDLASGPDKTVFYGGAAGPIVRATAEEAIADMLAYGTGSFFIPYTDKRKSGG